MSVDPSLKAYVSEIQELAATTYPCPICDKEDAIMYADGSWNLGGKKGNSNVKILQYKCSRCGATLRRAIRGEKPLASTPETVNPQSEQATPPTS